MSRAMAQTQALFGKGKAAAPAKKAAAKPAAKPAPAKKAGGTGKVKGAWLGSNSDAVGNLDKW